MLELGNFIAGPFAGQLLGDYGADVIKIEAPDGGDPMRRWGITHEGHGLWWPSIARNKRSVVADLRTEAGRELVQTIARTCDVIVENFRPGRLVEFGLDYESGRADEPRCDRRARVGFRADRTAVAARRGSDRSAKRSAGFATPPVIPTGPRRAAGVSLGDSLAALFAVIGTLAALREREQQRQGARGRRRDLRSGRGRDGVDDGRFRDRPRGARAQRRLTPGRRAVGRLPDGSTAATCSSPPTPTRCSRVCATRWRASDLATDARFATHAARGTNAAELDELIAQWTRQYDADAAAATPR